MGYLVSIHPMHPMLLKVLRNKEFFGLDLTFSIAVLAFRVTCIRFFPFETKELHGLVRVKNLSSVCALSPKVLERHSMRLGGVSF